jgi:hypothetical protein
VAGVDELVVIANVIGGVGRGVDIEKESNGEPFPYRAMDRLWG